MQEQGSISLICALYASVITPSVLCLFLLYLSLLTITLSFFVLYLLHQGEGEKRIMTWIHRHVPFHLTCVSFLHESLYGVRCHYSSVLVHTSNPQETDHKGPSANHQSMPPRRPGNKAPSTEKITESNKTKPTGGSRV